MRRLQGQVLTPQGFIDGHIEIDATHVRGLSGTPSDPLGPFDGSAIFSSLKKT